MFGCQYIVDCVDYDYDYVDYVDYDYVDYDWIVLIPGLVLYTYISMTGLC